MFDNSRWRCHHVWSCIQQCVSLRFQWCNIQWESAHSVKPYTFRESRCPLLLFPYLQCHLISHLSCCRIITLALQVSVVLNQPSGDFIISLGYHSCAGDEIAIITTTPTHFYLNHSKSWTLKLWCPMCLLGKLKYVSWYIWLSSTSEGFVHLQSKVVLNILEWLRAREQ